LLSGKQGQGKIVEKEITEFAIETPAKRGAGRPRQDDVEERTQELLEIAFLLFVEKGYGNVSLEAIAKAARVAVRTIYVKFGGKVGMFRAGIERERELYFGGTQSLEEDTRPMPVALLDFSKRFLDIVMTERSACLQRILITEGRKYPELIDAFNQAGPAQTRELIRRYFVRPDVRVQLRADVSVEDLVGQFLKCLIGDCLVRMLSNTSYGLTPEQRDHRAELAVSFFLSGAQNRTEPSA
jgi:AcrR family transcriptional regulator